MAGSLVPFCTHVMLQLSKEDGYKTFKLTKYVEGFLAESVKSLVKKCREEKKARLKMVENEIGQKVEFIEKHRAEIMAGIKLNYIDAYNMLTHFRECGFTEEGKCPRHLRNAINHWVTLPLFLDTLAGRPGGTSRMGDGAGKAMLEQNSEIKFLLATDHKTLHIYGPQPKSVTKALEQLIAMIEEFPRAGSGLFLEPPSFDPEKETPGKKGQSVYCTQLVKRGCFIYVQILADIFTCTLYRKLTTCLTSDTDRVVQRELRELCRLDGHSEQTAKSNYYTVTYEKAAAESTSKFQRMFGDVVPFPSQQECEAQREASMKRYDDHFRYFKKHSRKARHAKQESCDGEESGDDSNPDINEAGSQSSTASEQDCFSDSDLAALEADAEELSQGQLVSVAAGAGNQGDGHIAADREMRPGQAPPKDEVDEPTSQVRTGQAPTKDEVDEPTSPEQPDAEQGLCTGQGPLQAPVPNTVHRHTYTMTVPERDFLWRAAKLYKTSRKTDLVDESVSQLDTYAKKWAKQGHLSDQCTGQTLSTALLSKRREKKKAEVQVRPMIRRTHSKRRAVVTPSTEVDARLHAARAGHDHVESSAINADDSHAQCSHPRSSSSMPVPARTELPGADDAMSADPPSVADGCNDAAGDGGAVGGDLVLDADAGDEICKLLALPPLSPLLKEEHCEPTASVDHLAAVDTAVMNGEEHIWESIAYELGVGTHMPDATIAAEGVEQAATTPPTHEVLAGGRDGNTDGDSAMHIEEFLRNERQVTPTDGQVQERKSRVYMTVDEKRYALAQLEEHVTSHGYGANPDKHTWGKHVLATGVIAKEIRGTVRSNTIWQLAMRFLIWRRGRPIRVPAGPPNFFNGYREALPTPPNPAHSIAAALNTGPSSSSVAVRKAWLESHGFYTPQTPTRRMLRPMGATSSSAPLLPGAVSGMARSNQPHVKKQRHGTTSPATRSSMSEPTHVDTATKGPAVVRDTTVEHTLESSTIESKVEDGSDGEASDVS